MIEAQAGDRQLIPLLGPGKELYELKLSATGAKAQRLIKRYALMASGLGFVPMAHLTAQAAVTGLLLKLLNDLCRLYGVRFSEQQSKIIVASILGGAHFHWISRYLIRFVKGCHSLSWSSAGLLLNPVVSGALVYYIGRLFLVHLESGVWHAVLVKPR
jgi:uncharacterized protein (DUF697 family)